MFKRKKNKLLFSLFLIIFVFTFYFVNNNLSAQQDFDSQERDAIAVRVLPNPNNYSIEAWYQKQGFTGSPQSLVVDGYRAIRDGRTVYVNAANVVDNKLYTNIYLISHNQEPDIKTIDILGRIVDGWKFNKNLDDPGTCSIASQRCSSDEDCAGDLVCRTRDFNEEGADLRCRISEDDADINCLIDSRCPNGIYCDSLKAKVTRDVRRLANLTDIKEALENYRQVNNRYPILQSGTYIRHHSLSVWPSWQQSFIPEIGLSDKLDPINRLGDCGENFDPVTCWNQETSQFYNFSNNQITLPEHSYGFAYSGNATGSDYDLCAVLESHLAGIDNAEGNLSEKQCLIEGTGYDGTIDPESIEIQSYSLTGMPNREFSGFVRVSNPSNYPLDWSLDAGGGWDSWSESPLLQETNNPNQRRVWAERAGDPGNYTINLDISSAAGDINESFDIEIVDSIPFIEMPSNIDYYLNPNNPLKFSAEVTDDYTPITIEGVDSGLSGESNYETQVIGNSKTIDFEQEVTGVFKNDQTVQGFIEASNSLDRENRKNFNINVKVTLPILDFVCSHEARFDKYYECFLGKDKQGDFSIDYFSSSNFPAGLKIDKVEDNWILSGKTKSSDDIGETYEINIGAKNDYETENNRKFNIKINSFCGDGTVQKPNTEGRGGFYNDGNEDCDGAAGTTNIPKDSHVGLQYACNMGEEDETPYPILTGNYCVFKSPLEGGGYCGDGLCQTDIENSSNCPEDCGGSDNGDPGDGDNGDDEEESCQGQYFAGYCELKDSVDPKTDPDCIETTKGGSSIDEGSPDGCQSHSPTYCIRNRDRSEPLTQYHEDDCVLNPEWDCGDFETTECDLVVEDYHGTDPACEPVYEDCDEFSSEDHCNYMYDDNCYWE